LTTNHFVDDDDDENVDDNDPIMIQKKITKSEYETHYTDYEYIYLQILGFQATERKKEDITAKNNKQFFSHNPGTKLLERVAGITMHGEREGSDLVVKQAYSILIAAYRLARETNQLKIFFETGFDRLSDPCLEGRVGRLQTFLELNNPQLFFDVNHRVTWDDVSINRNNYNNNHHHQNQNNNNNSNSEKLLIVGEYLRVFTNLMLLKYAKDKNKNYSQLKHDRSLGLNLPGFDEEYCNTETFQLYLSNEGLIKPATLKPTTTSTTQQLLSEAADLMKYYVELDTLFLKKEQ